MINANSLRKGQEILTATLWKDEERKDNYGSDINLVRKTSMGY